ncbi:MAG TPA: ABC transporter permease [Terracidiphilus sp.]|nr:ABC transporter permease [Terracidiphilus sp.]
MNPFTRLFGRPRRYNDLSVSIQEHIAERADELVAEGMAAADAEKAAQREFGNVGLVEQRSREAWQWPALESVLADLKFVFRRLRKSPGFTVTVLLTLAIGIGANTAVFSVLNSVILRPLPYPAADRLVSLHLDAPGAGGLGSFATGLPVSPSMYFTFSDHNDTFQSLGIWAGQNANVTGIAQPEEVQTALVSGGVLETLAVPPMLGRWFSSADQDPHGSRTVMLSYGYWQRRFGGDRSVIGRMIQVDALPRQIVGVMPRGFEMIDQNFDILLPLAFDRAQLKMAPFGYYGIGRLKPGVSLEQADHDLARLLPVWMNSWTNGPGTNPHWYEHWRITPAFRPLKQEVVGEVSKVLWVVMATIGVVMLIACTNVANLLLVRAEARQQELSVRAALGAGRGRIARELLMESLVLGLLGGLFAVAIAYQGLRLLVFLEPADLPRLSEISLDARSLIFTLLLSVFSGLVLGAIPALKYAGARMRTLYTGATRTASSGRDRQRVRSILVVAQVAMAFVLLVSALLMIRTFAALRSVEPGFRDPAHVETMQVFIPGSLVPDGVMVTHIQKSIADRLSAIPGVTAVGFGAAVPMDGNDPNWDQILVEGRTYQGVEPPLYLYDYVAPGYFNAIGTRVVAGRDFTWTDLYNLQSKVMVSEGFAREYWGSAGAAIGKHVREFEKKPWIEVIGVVEDVRQHGVDHAAPATVYWPILRTDPYTPMLQIDGPQFAAFAIRTSRAGNENLVREIQDAVWSVNSSLPVASIRTMQEIYGKSLARTSFTLVMLAIAGSMALTLGLLGIYGVISYTVSQRTREIGIRLALGAQKSNLKWMFVRAAMVLTATGVGLGLCGAAVLTQSMKSLLFEISPLDPLTYVVIPLVLIASAVVASYLPARRAASVNPVDALRAE